MRAAGRLRRVSLWAAALLAGAVSMLAGLALALDARFPPDLRRFLDRSAVVLDEEGRVLRAFTASDGIWRLPAGPRDVAPVYLTMLKGYEDRRFDSHIGVDPAAVVRAVGQAVLAGRVVSGASTLTMQTARLLEPRPRTLASKLIEMARAIQLEAHFDKDEILSMYLTLAPFGGNLEGIRAASLAYFGVEPRALTPGQAALLVALPQSPTRLRPDRSPGAALGARDRVLSVLAGAGILDPATASEAMDEAGPTTRANLPFHAPHLAERLVAGAGGRQVATLIDGPLQASVEDLAGRSVRNLHPMANLAILVVRNSDRAVRAYVGSAGYFEDRRDGGIDFARAVRSPGSALKPFIYGMGFDDRIIHPETLIRDQATRFGDYAPTNFEGGFMGEVSVARAMSLSLNVPAVAILDRVGPKRLAARLSEAGTPLRLPPGTLEPGLPIALGGAGTTLGDLVTLYAGLAEEGVVLPLRFTSDDDSGTPVRIVEPASAWYLASILASAPMPASLIGTGDVAGGRTVAWKTGTSYGFRDAWAIGWDADWTVGVWVGRPDGSPMPDRIGRDTAAPILFKTFGLLPRGPVELPGPPPEGAVLAMHDALPPHLVRFQSGFVAPPSMASGTPLELAFPVDGTELDLAGASTLPLTATGGRRPFVWLVDGRPIPVSPVRRDAVWQVDTRGQVRITVIDAEGNVASSAVFLR